jgi:hypothetical protein
MPLDQRAHRCFGSAVGGRDRAQIRFVVDHEPGAEIGPDRGPGRVGEVRGEGDKGVDVDQRGSTLFAEPVPALG